MAAQQPAAMAAQQPAAPPNPAGAAAVLRLHQNQQQQQPQQQQQNANNGIGPLHVPNGLFAEQQRAGLRRQARDANNNAGAPPNL